MLRLVECFRENISLLNISGSALTIASLHGLNIIYQNSNQNDGIFKHRMAAIGLCMIIGDAINVMIYKSKYPMEPLFPVENEMIPKNVGLLYQTVETICSDALPCLTCSLYIHYGIPLCGRFQFAFIKIVKEVDWFYKNVFRPKCQFWKIPFVELFLSGNILSFGLLNDNHYALMAAAPFQIATLFYKPNYYYSRKYNRVIYQFLMIPYVILITKALCEPMEKG